MAECCRPYQNTLTILREIRSEIRPECVPKLDEVLALIAKHYEQHVEETGEAL